MPHVAVGERRLVASARTCSPPASTPAPFPASRSAAGRHQRRRPRPGCRPERVVVLGGGVIGVELRSVMRSFGAEVAFVEALPRLAVATENAVRSGTALERAFRKRGIAFRPGVRFESVAVDGTPSRCGSRAATRFPPTCSSSRWAGGPVTDGSGLRRKPGSPSPRASSSPTPGAALRRAGLRGGRHRPRPAARPPRVRRASSWPRTSPGCHRRRSWDASRASRTATPRSPPSAHRGAARAKRRGGERPVQPRRQRRVADRFAPSAPSSW